MTKLALASHTLFLASDSIYVVRWENDTFKEVYVLEASDAGQAVKRVKAWIASVTKRAVTDLPGIFESFRIIGDNLTLLIDAQRQLGYAPIHFIKDDTK